VAALCDPNPLRAVRNAAAKSTGKDHVAQWRRSALLLCCFFILVANFGWGFILDHYELVYSTLGVCLRCRLAAANVTRIAFWVMTGASTLACVLLAFGFFRPRKKQVVAGIVTYVALYVVGVLALPYLFQTFVVKPNELSVRRLI